MKLITVVGTRPQFIKAAPVMRALDEVGIKHLLIDTGQHYDSDMSGNFFRELALPTPNYSLRVGSGSHARMTAKMLEGIETALMAESPDMVLVFGDTNSTLAGAVTAAKLGIPVAHVEAGLRSFRPIMPEEINRRLTDHCAAILFCPSETAIRQLKAEGLARANLPEELYSLEQCRSADVSLRPLALNVGDVMVDALISMRERYEKQPPSMDLPAENYALFTLHRAESTDDAGVLHQIVNQVSELASAMRVLFPVHPRTKARLVKCGSWNEILSHPGIQCRPPLSYGAFTWALLRAKVIITDSGGVQKEAAIHGVPCITLRDETEWVETIESGWNRLVGRRPQLLREKALAAKSPTSNPLTCYGDGRAAQKIASILLRV